MPITVRSRHGLEISIYRLMERAVEINLQLSPEFLVSGFAQDLTNLFRRICLAGQAAHHLAIVEATRDAVLGKLQNGTLLRQFVTHCDNENLQKGPPNQARFRRAYHSRVAGVSCRLIQAMTKNYTAIISVLHRVTSHCKVASGVASRLVHARNPVM